MTDDEFRAAIALLVDEWRNQPVIDLRTHCPLCGADLAPADETVSEGAEA